MSVSRSWIPGSLKLAAVSLALLLPACLQKTEPWIESESSALESRELLALTDWRELPFTHGVRYGVSTSTDRGRIPFEDYPVGNKDFGNIVAACDRPPLRVQHEDNPELCDEGIEGYVIAAADDGPGVVSRLFLTGLKFQSERLRVYADELDEPVLDQPLSSWRSGEAAPLTQWTSGALISYLPIAYRSRLRVVLDRVKSSSLVYFQVARNQGTPEADFGRGIPARSITDRLAHPGPSPSGEADVRDLDLEPDTARVLFESNTGGTIERIRLTLSPPTRSTLSNTTVRASWDGDKPAIDLPLSELFGVARDLTSFETAAMSLQVGDETLELTFALPMPFQQGARLEVVNSGVEPASVHSEIIATPDAVSCNAGQLHVQSRARLAPFGEGERYRVAEIHGHGKYLGTLMCLRGGGDGTDDWPNAFSFLEGDDRTSVDGQLIAHGTGTEDYFNAGWYYEDGPYNSAYSALISLETDEDAGTGRACMLRWHLLSDAIEFEKSFQLDFEYGNDAPGTAHEYASVAFYYLQPDCAAPLP